MKFVYILLCSGFYSCYCSYYLNDLSWNRNCNLEGMAVDLCIVVFCSAFYHRVYHHFAAFE